MHRLRKAAQNSILISLCVSVCVALAVILLRSTGYLQSLELKAYDWQLGWCGATKKTQPPILIVAATENDVRTHGWPLTDEKLAVILQKLVNYKARAIGLDIYRDLEVAPGSEKLNEVLSTNSHIIAATKYPEKDRREIPPPPILRGTNQVGINDVIVDPDGIVRRGLIYLDDGKSPESIVYSLAVKLALSYLGKDKLEFDASEPPNLLWGRSLIRPFEANDGGYSGADAAGYQFLLDFEDAPPDLSPVSVSQVLSDDVNRELIEDKIILVGVTAESVPDIFHIAGAGRDKSGNVIYGVGLHASVVGQLLRLARGDSQPITSTSEKTELMLIVFGAFIGAGIGRLVRSP